MNLRKQQMPLYKKMVGSLMYLTNTRPDICFVVNTLSQYMVNPKHIKLVGEKHVMRYLKGTLDYGLIYASNGKIILHGFTDRDWAGSVEDKKSTSRCCFSLGLDMISWFSRKQSNIALSTTEFEYITTCSSCSKVVWLCKMLAKLFDAEIDTTDILCDNQSCIKLKENPVFHDKSKHIEVGYHYIRDMVQKGAIKLKYVPIEEQVADVLTKPRLV